MDNISDLFTDSKGSTEAPADPTWDYKIDCHGGETTTQRGYLVVNSVFAAICRGDNGVIYWLRPMSEIKEIVNLGEVQAGPLN